MKGKLFWIGGVVVILLILAVSGVGAAADKVVLCHKPGTPAEGTLEVATAAVQAHLDHGDVLGECGGTTPTDMCAAFNDPAYDGTYYWGELKNLMPYSIDWPKITWTRDSGAPFIEISFSRFGEPYEGSWRFFSSSVTLPEIGTQLGGWRVGTAVNLKWNTELGDDNWTVTCCRGPDDPGCFE